MTIQRKQAIVGLLSVVLGGSATQIDAGCPSPAEIGARVQALHLERGARTARFEVEPPRGLYEKAAKKVGQPFATRDGHKGAGVIVAELPLAALWKALNDEDNHATEESAIPIQHSEVIGGTPRGVSRVVFQYMRQMGVGRWWVSRVWMNRELYEQSDGQLLELLWKDQMDDVDPSQPPVNGVSSELTPIKRSQGAWLLAPIDDTCTLVEYFNWSDPGGMVGWLQPLVVGRALRQTLSGVVGLAGSYPPSAESDSTFRLPDGTPMD